MIKNRSLLLPYAAPYFAYVLIASLLGDVVSDEINYILRILAAVGLLIWGWRWYIPLIGNKPLFSSLLQGGIFGIVGCAVWIILLLPFTEAAEATPWSTSGFALRVVSAGFLVPVFEELMIRGFAFRLALQWDQCRKEKIDDPLYTALHERSINDLKPGQWSWMAVIISTLVFMIGHGIPEWPAAIAYGLLMSFLLIRQKDLIACIFAHGVTNLSLAAYVALTGSWQLW